MRIDTGKPRGGSHDDDQDPIEELLLTAFPNPERTGCPGPTVIEDYGNQRIDDESVWEHISKCSPCFSEFKLVRDTRWKAEAKKERQRKRRLAAVAAAAAVLLLAIGITYLLLNRKPAASFSPQPSLLATIDLSKASVVRGAGDGSHELHLPPISKRATELQIIMPPFSGTGHYVVAILRSRNDEAPVAKGSGIATGSDAHAEVRIGIDLSRLEPGDYLLATWRDADRALYYYPLQIVH